MIANPKWLPFRASTAAACIMMYPALSIGQEPAASNILAQAAKLYDLQEFSELQILLNGINEDDLEADDRIRLLDYRERNKQAIAGSQAVSEVLQSVRFSSSSRFASEAKSAQLSTVDMLNPRVWYESARDEVWKQHRSPWELVTSEEHRDLLLRALHTASRSIVVVSGDLTESAADRLFLDYLSAAVQRGVNITILWGSQDADGMQESSSSRVVADIRTASKGKHDLVKVNEEPRPVHAKLLIIDDEVSVITSFNFLSYRGTRSGAHELGMKVYDPTLSIQLHKIVDEAMTG